MSHSGPRGDRTTGAVSPLLLVVGGLLVSLVASVLLVLQGSGGGSEVAVPTAVHTDPPRPTTATPVVPPDAPPTRSSTASSTTSTARVEEPTTSTAARPTAESARAAAPAQPTPTAAPEAKGPVAPTWISIAAGGVDGPLTPQGLAADGTINPGRNQIIWFTGYGRVSPGQTGTAVIAAHVTWGGAPDAFVNLPNVGVGDVVSVGYSDGSTASFTVVETRSVDKDALARSATVWGAHPGVSRLAIITCDPSLGYQADGHTAGNYLVVAEG